MSNDKKDNLLENKNLENKNLENKTEKKLEKKFDIALKNRNFEIRLFWQRSNYFLALNSAIALAFFSFLENDYNSKIPSFMAFFGLIVSCLWLKVLFGGKFWQIYWEAKLKKLEESLEPIPNTILFNNNEKHDEEVVNGFINNKNNKNNENNENGFIKKLIKKCINKQILKKPSVSNTMIGLSAGFMVLWLILLLYTFTLIYTPSFFLPMGYSIISIISF